MCNANQKSRLVSRYLRFFKGFLMSSDNELKVYLQFLIDHSDECSLEACPLCASFDRVCELLRYQIFSGPVFPEVMRSTARHAS